MDEFLFPPGRIPSFLIMPIHAAFVSIIVISAVGLIWRCRRPAVGGNIVGWWFAFGGALVLCQLCSGEEVLSPYWAGYTRVVGYLACFASLVTMIRLKWPKASVLRTVVRGLVCVVPVAALLEFLLAAGGVLPFASDRAAWQRSNCGNQLRYILFAMHSYDEIHRHLLPPTIEANGLPSRSWRVDLLPFLDQAPLRKRYTDNDQWNGPQNSTLSQLMPYELACTANPRPRMLLDGVEWQTTGYAMVKGPHAFGTATGRKLSNFPDGVANTVAVVEASGRMIPWLKPEDVEPTPETTGINMPGVASGRSRGVISSYHPGGANIAMADGSVRFLSERVDPKILQAILTADGGETPGGF